MIQLIASDMDGTLLAPYTPEVSAQAKQQIDRLIQHGILFCPASGRQYPCLKMMFEPLGDRIPYICENGAAVIVAGEAIATAPLNKTWGRKLMQEIVDHPCNEIQTNVVHTCYLQPKSQAYLDLMNGVGNHNTVVEDIFTTLDEDLLKISVYCPEGVTTEYLTHLQNTYGHVFQILQSSANFIDATAKGINKGWGMARLAEYLAIPTEDIIAMGDHNNDVEMLEVVGHPVAMANGLPHVQSIASRVIDKVENFLDDLLDAIEKNQEVAFLNQNS